MSFKPFIKRKEVILENGYAGIRTTLPVDNIALSAMLGAEKDDNTVVENCMVAQSLEWVELPLEDLEPEDYLIIHPTNPDNYIEVDDFSAKKLKDGTYPKKKILDPNRPHNYVVKKECVRRYVFPKAESVGELMNRMIVPMSDWLIIAEASIRLNEPNPALLGK